jgi:hypothetical protein
MHAYTVDIGIARLERIVEQAFGSDVRGTYAVHREFLELKNSLGRRNH